MVIYSSNKYHFLLRLNSPVEKKTENSKYNETVVIVRHKRFRYKNSVFTFVQRKRATERKENNSTFHFPNRTWLLSSANTQFDWFCAQIIYFVFSRLETPFLFFISFTFSPVWFPQKSIRCNAAYLWFSIIFILCCFVFAIKISSCAPHTLWPSFFSCLSLFASIWTFTTRLSTRPNGTK